MYLKDDPVHGFYHNDIYIKSQSVSNHLGYCIGPKLDSKDVKHVSNNFCVAFNSLMSIFGNLNCQLKYRLFKTYCMPLYGSVLWDLNPGQLAGGQLAGGHLAGDFLRDRTIGR